MNKNKVCKELTLKVTVLNKKSKNIFVFSENSAKTQYFLDVNKFNYKFYPFINCFFLPADDDDINILSHQQHVSFIQSNPYVQALRTEEDFLNITNLTENKFFGQNQTICFIDTGIYPHLDFVLPKSKIIKFIDLINDKNSPYDDNGHGTFVAGIACGNGILSSQYSGFAKCSKIISIKALQKNGSSTSNTILDAMQWIYENHKKYNISIVCMSFGAESDETFDPLSLGAEALWKAGITVVAAAGNSGPNTKTIKSPGCNPYVITVGALDIKTMEIANFSSRGPTIYGHKPDLLAPAVDIVSCNHKFLPYTTMSGTSVATPIVAGICAIIKSKYPQMTNNQIKKYLFSNCKKITGNADFEGAGFLKF
jgi:serine protease AprX